MELVGARYHQRISFCQVGNGIYIIAKVVTYHAASLHDNTQRGQEGFSGKYVSDVDKGIVGPAGDVDDIHCRTTGTSNLPYYRLLHYQLPEFGQVTPVKIHACNTRGQVLCFTDLAAASIAKSATAMLRLVDGTAEQFPHQRPLHMLRCNRCVDWQDRQCHSSGHDASGDIGGAIDGVNHDTVGRCRVRAERRSLFRDDFKSMPAFY